MSAEKKKAKFFYQDSPRMVFLVGFFAGIIFLILVALIAFLVLSNRQEGVSFKIVNQTDNSSQVEEEISSGINIEAIAFSEEDQVKGEEKADYVLVVYMDFESAHSKQFYTPLNNFYQENSDKVKIVWRHFPLDFHAHARSAAIAAECAGKQDKFWEYADKLFELQDQLSDSLYTEIAQELSLEASQFESCLNSDEVKNLVSFHLEEGMAAGVSGTPNVIFLDQAEDTFKFIGGSVNEDYLTSLLK